MRKRRSQIIDLSISRHYHVTSRCVRGAYLLQDGDESRKTQIEERLKELEAAFAVDVCSHSIMDNHFHVVLRLNPEEADRWTDRNVVERWYQIHPLRNGSRRQLPITEKWIERELADTKQVAKTREKLCSASQFMKDLKQPIAQQANRKDRRTGHFWDGRFHAVAILDDAALLAVTTYVDLNPFAAGACERPEDARHTSLRERVRALKVDATLGEAEDALWLVPIEAIEENADGNEQKRQGLLRGLSETDYLKLVDSCARLVRAGKHHLDENALPILERIHITPDNFVTVLERLCENSTRRGHVIGRPEVDRDVRDGRR